MIRNLNDLANQEFDLLVIGGGIQGALACWDASLRGLKTAMIERGDFGSGTSQNSLRIVHGGLRYLQDGNLARMRSMARERSTWMRIAPHLVHPLTCLLPTWESLTHSRLAMRAALSINDLVSLDRNRDLAADKEIPNGTIISNDRLAAMLPGLDTRDFSGAAVWQDAQIQNSERLLLSIVKSALQAGAVAANYVEARSLLVGKDVVKGARARDHLSGDEFDIRAKLTLNCTAAWSERLFSRSTGARMATSAVPSLALNLVVNQLWPHYAVGLRSREENHPAGGQILFFVPWQGYTLIGTRHYPLSAQPDEVTASQDMLADFLAAANSAHPDLNLKLEDIRHVHWGFLPQAPGGRQNGHVKLVREGLVIDHQTQDGVAGIISLLGVKYTTARLTAERGINLALRKLGWPAAACRTAHTPIYGGEVGHFTPFLAAQQEEQAACGYAPEEVERLVKNHGQFYRQILKLCADAPSLRDRLTDSVPVLKAEILHAVREEMAQTLLDVLQRRTELGCAGLPEPEVIAAGADLMANKSGCDEAGRYQEVEQVYQAYPMRAYASQGSH